VDKPVDNVDNITPEKYKMSGGEIRQMSDNMVGRPIHDDNGNPVGEVCGVEFVGGKLAQINIRPSRKLVRDVIVHGAASFSIEDNVP
jgi:hypothetical protein